MKKFLLVLVTLFTLNLVTYASFPITENVTPSELVVENDNLTLEVPYGGGGPGWGIAALCCGILGLFIPLLGIPAIVFGAIGLNKELKGMAITGMILGLLELIFLVVLIVLFSSLGYF